MKNTSAVATKAKTNQIAKRIKAQEKAYVTKIKKGL